jgi:hypothetical protein
MRHSDEEATARRQWDSEAMAYEVVQLWASP